MNSVSNFTCPSCGAPWPSAELTCQEAFHQMLFWENEDPRNGEVHHLMVLCYYLQHPELYSPEGLQHALGLLVDFLERGQSPAELRRRRSAQVDSSRRRWKVTAHPNRAGAYACPVHWRMTARDVLAGGIEDYIGSVNRWAAATLADLRESRNL